MNPQVAQQAQNYLRTRVLTATPEQLQMMLFDGAVKFLEQGRIALEKKDWEQSYTHISKTQKIIAELLSGLRHDMSPGLCGKLASIYNYVYRKLIEANVDHSIDALDEGLKLMRFQRETWAMLLAELGKQKAGTAAAKIDMPAPNAAMEARIRMTA